MIFKLVTFLFLQSVSATIFLDCEYRVHAFDWGHVGSLYTCFARVTQTGLGRNVVGVSQNHLAGRSNWDVRMLAFTNQQIVLIPTDINIHFPNLDGIDFNNCPIRSFTKDDLRPFPRLKYFAVFRGQLQTISGDVLVYSREMVRFHVGNNQITNIRPNLLQHSPRLTHAFFQFNLCINRNAVNSATAVAAIGRELTFTCPPTTEMIEEIILQGQNFQFAVNNLVEINNRAIIVRVEQIEKDYRTLSNNHTIALRQIQQLQEESQNADERISSLEEKFFNLCSNHNVCL